MRYWLAASGALAERDYDVVVTPPARMVEALRSGRIAGFCAGAPWGDIAERAGVGATVATSWDVWRNGPGKALAMRERWSDANPKALAGLLRALHRAARFCDAPANAPMSPRCSPVGRGSRSTATPFCRRCQGLSVATGHGSTTMRPPIRGGPTRSGS